MLKRLAACVREFKKPTVLTLFFIVGESIIETMIPFITSNLVNDIKGGVVLSQLLRSGGLLLLLAMLSLGCGGAAGARQRSLRLVLPATCGTMFSAASSTIPLKTSTVFPPPRW